jgi:hypothetical protein
MELGPVEQLTSSLSGREFVQAYRFLWKMLSSASELDEAVHDYFYEVVREIEQTRSWRGRKLDWVRGKR